MKTRIIHGWLFGILLAAAAATSGCAHEGLNTPPKASSSDPAAAATPAANTSAAPQSSPAAPAAPGKQGDPSLPPRISVSPWAHEIQKLVQADVAERVITSYITNSAGMFTADYAPEQPEGIGPVRARYAVKLNDPIIMLRVPTLTVPCW